MRGTDIYTQEYATCILSFLCISFSRLSQFLSTRDHNTTLFPFFKQGELFGMNYFCIGLVWSPDRIVLCSSQWTVALCYCSRDQKPREFRFCSTNTSCCYCLEGRELRAFCTVWVSSETRLTRSAGQIVQQQRSAFSWTNTDRKPVLSCPALLI